MQARLFLPLVLLLMGGLAPGQSMPSGTPTDWAAAPPRWKPVGAALMATAPQFVRSGTPCDKLRHLYLQYCALLVQHRAPLNGSFGTRVSVGLSVFTCGNHALNLENLFAGAGLSGVTYAMLRSAPAGWLDYIKKGVNCDHGALGAVVDGVVLVFDPWLPAFLTNQQYGNDMQADFGGVPYPLWEMTLRAHGYDAFQAGNETWQPSVKLALDAANIPSKVAATPPPPARALIGAHWRLTEILPMPYNANDPNSAVGGIFGHSWFWWKVEEQGVERFARMKVHAAMAPHAAVLIPNTRVAVTASMREAFGHPFRSGATACEIKWCHDAADGRTKTWSPSSTERTIGRIDKEQQTERKDTQFEIPVPMGTTGEAFRILMVAPPGTMRYTYAWIDGGTPMPPAQAAITFSGRWQTAWGIVTLRQRGPDVDGSYPHDGGRIRGSIAADGRTLTGTWSETPTYQPPDDAGELTFVLDPDGMGFKGRYWYGKRPEGDPGRDWHGTRIQ